MEIVDILKAIVYSWEFQWVVYVIAANVALGVIGSIIIRDFSFRQVADFLYDKVLKLLVPYGVVKFLAVTVGDPFIGMALVAWAAVELALLASIYNRLREFGLGRWLPYGSNLTSRE